MSDLITDEMVEIAARAMWDHDWPDKPWESLPDNLAYYYRSRTRATLESVVLLIAAKAWDEVVAAIWDANTTIQEPDNPYRED